MYAKLINEHRIIDAPRTIILDGLQITNPSKEQYMQAGYYPVSTTTCPQFDWYHNVIPNYELIDGIIIQSWIVQEVYRSNEEVTAKRQECYASEADQHLTAYQGYLLEGKVEAAEEQRLFYIEKKDEIRAKYPYNSEQ